MFDLATVAAVTVTFFLAGTVKGVTGLGLPTVSLALLSLALDLPTAMALLLVPSFITNLWQATTGGNARLIVGRLWLFFLMATVTVWFGALALSRLNPALLTGLLGALLVTYSAVNLGGIRLTIPDRYQLWAGPVFGAINGLLTGMTGSFVVPGVMFLQAIGLPRDALIQAMGMLFTLSTVALGVSLQQSRLLDLEQALISTGAVAPALAGMLFGQLIRKRLAEERFRTIFFVTLLALGAYILARPLLGLR
ncbi:MAG: sulfite exporter TauE/SafE family protein [Desulfopila sp.]